MKQLIATRGLQASGKSSWAKQWVLEDPEHRIRFNNDDLRIMSGKYWVTSREPLITNIKTEFIKNAMYTGYDIVVDNMNLNPKEQQYLQNLVDVHNAEIDEGIIKGEKYELKFKDFFISLKECIKRDSFRPNPIGEKIIKESHRRYKTQIAKWRNTEYWNDRQEFDESLPKAVLVDLDRTIAYNMKGRPFYGEGCAEMIQYDKPDKNLIDILWALHFNKVNIIFLTGRDESVREASEKWIKENTKLPDFLLIMRKERDYRTSEECKSDLYDQFIEDKYNVIATFDDDNDEMWRKKGLLHLKPIS